MYELTKADRIWNRACSDESNSLLEGDRALRAVLALHGLAMNGGVLHALECLDPQAVVDAESGYRFFGLDSVAELVHEAKSMSTNDDLELWEIELDRRYGALVPADSMLVQQFELVLDRNPSVFAPL